MSSPWRRADTGRVGRRALLGLAAVLLTATGCAPGLKGLRAEGLASRAEVGGLRAFRQEERACGPAALATLLEWAGSPATPEALGPLVYLPGRSGTLPMDLSREVRERGLLAYRTRPDASALLREVAAGHPVLVLENRGLSFAPLWHYSVLGGYDLGEGTVTLYSGSATPEQGSLARFRRAWSRAGGFGLLALPPGEIPA
ncbi:MAG: PA2778 family cysteine peptidase, partial [Deltaproteobacteria bacterium]|nr:PA2778 family cysteine peptidase [Deltaproteobacteria bacterium]